MLSSILRSVPKETRLLPICTSISGEKGREWASPTGHGILIVEEKIENFRQPDLSYQVRLIPKLAPSFSVVALVS